MVILGYEVSIVEFVAAIFEALIFTSSVECDPLFLVLMCVAASVGLFGFATVVTKWPRNKIRWALGIVMIPLAIILFVRISNLDHLE